MIWAMAAFIVILMVLIAWGDVKLMVGFVLLVAVVAGSYLAYEKWAEKRAAELVALSEVELKGFEMQRLAGSVYELTGRVHNHAGRYSLKELVVRVTAQDCESQKNSECITIAQTRSRLDMDVPAGQARDIEEKIVFREGRPEPRGELRWRFDVLATQGG